MTDLSLASCDLGATLAKASSRSRLKALQKRLKHLELAYKFSERRAIIVIEGWDAVGKGGVIRRLTTALDPRGFAVWPIGPPTAAELARHYLQRFWRLLPARGTWAVFDRSWYGRVLVERVEKLADAAEWGRAYDEINAFEAMLAADGVRIVKLFLHMSATEQVRRFAARIEDPTERWKMSAADLRNRDMRADYEQAIDDMLARTSTPDAPWRVIAFEQKRFGRVAAIEHVVKSLGKGMDMSLPPLASDIAQGAADLLREAAALGRLDEGRGAKPRRLAKRR